MSDPIDILHDLRDKTWSEFVSIHKVVDGLVDQAQADTWASFLKMRILDQWYRFAEFGVEGRADIANLVVTCTVTAVRAKTTFVLTHTKLEHKL